ncbi:MAG: secondary thiamine-phosphate synthase enzyme YjbQ [Mycobacteriales bacterium]
MDTTTFEVDTGPVPAVADITERCAQFVSGRADGLLHVFVPHATAGLALLELGSGSEEDLLRTLETLLPTTAHWRHRHGSQGHGRAHVLPVFLAPSLVLPVFTGRVALGTWQSVALVDLNVDNERRTVRLSWLAGEPPGEPT